MDNPRLPEIDGFEVVRRIGAERMPATIFVTADDRYALPAFEADAIDYLLKPVGRARFEKALARAKGRIPEKSNRDAAQRNPYHVGAPQWEEDVS